MSVKQLVLKFESLCKENFQISTTISVKPDWGLPLLGGRVAEAVAFFSFPQPKPKPLCDTAKMEESSLKMVEGPLTKEAKEPWNEENSESEESTLQYSDGTNESSEVEDPEVLKLRYVGDINKFKKGLPRELKKQNFGRPTASCCW